MAPLAHPRHEAIAVARVKGIALGETQTDAYKRVGYRGTGHAAHVNASRVLRRAEVSARIAELQRQAAERSLTTIEKITNDLDEARQLAFQEGQAHAAVSASMAKAKLHGLVVNRTERAVEPPAKTLDEVVDGIVKEAGSTDAALKLVEALRAMILARIDPDSIGWK